MDITIYRYSDLTTVANVCSQSINEVHNEGHNGMVFNNFIEYITWALDRAPLLSDYKEFVIECKQCRHLQLICDSQYIINYGRSYAKICNIFQQEIDKDSIEKEWVTNDSDDTQFIKSIEDYSFSDDLDVDTKNKYLLRAIKALTKSLI